MSENLRKLLARVTDELDALNCAFREHIDDCAEPEEERERCDATDELLEQARAALADPAPAQDEREAVERFSPTTSVPHCGRASEVETYMTEDDDGEYMTVAQHERIVAALTRPAQTATLKPHQLRELVNDLRDVARKYHATEQLREQIAHTLRNALSAGGRDE